MDFCHTATPNDLANFIAITEHAHVAHLPSITLRLRIVAGVLTIV